MSKRRRRIKIPDNCPRCGGRWVRRSGFRMCEKCSHVEGTQFAFTDWNLREYGRVLRAPLKERAHVLTSPHPRGRRNQPLELK
jgi:hypothetical protein